MSDELSLKWGTFKGCDLESEAARAAWARYAETGRHSESAMMQHDTEEQKRALCDLIDAIDGTIRNDWEGTTMSKEEAKAYVREYGRK